MGLKVQDIGLDERVESLDEFKALTLNQQEMCRLHVEHPTWTRMEIGRRVGVSHQAVSDFFLGDTWARVNQELAKYQIRELIHLAVHTLRNCMLNGKDEVKLDAAVRVLGNADLLKTRNMIKRQDNKMVVVWGNDSVEPAAKVGVATAPALTNGDHNPISSPSETAGSSRI